MRVLQVTLGIVCGLLMAFLGAVVSALSIVSNFTIEGGNGTVQAKIATTSPGVLLIICGSVIMSFSLSQKLSIDSEDGHVSTSTPPYSTLPLENSIPPKY